MPSSSSLYPHVRKAWENVRFRGKTDEQISYETGVKPHVVARARAICTGKTSPRGRKTAINPSEIDWKKPNSEIAEDLGLSYETVHLTRAILRAGKPRRKRTQEKGLHESTLAKFANVDWDMIDEAIAKEVGVTRQRVHQIRHKLGKPVAAKFSHIQIWFENNKDKISEMTAREASRRAGHTLHVMYAYASKMGLKFKKVTYTTQPWHLVNWDLPNKDITEIWKIKDPPSGNYGSRVGLTRYQKKKGPPKWDMRFGREINDPQYAEAIKTETKRASAWFKEKAINKKEQHHGLRAAR